MEDYSKYEICPACGRRGKYSLFNDMDCVKHKMEDFKNKLVIYCDHKHEPRWVTAKEIGKPMGYMADSALRKWRNDLHAVFDKLWEENLMTRQSAYAWLATKLYLTKTQCHISRLTPEQCSLALELSKQKYEDLSNAGINVLQTDDSTNNAKQKHIRLKKVKKRMSAWNKRKLYQSYRRS